MRTLGFALALSMGLVADAAGQRPRVTVYTDHRFIGQITAVAEGDRGSRCERSIFVERRDGEEPFPNWALTQFEHLRVCVRVEIPITVWTEADTLRTGTLDELQPGVYIRVNLRQGVFMTEPPTADATSLDILEYVRRRNPGAGGGDSRPPRRDGPIR